MESTIVTAQSISAMQAGVSTQKNILDLDKAAETTEDLRDAIADMEELHEVCPLEVRSPCCQCSIRLNRYLLVHIT